MNNMVHKKFECRVCGGMFHIKRRNASSGDWHRFMPPKFCPGCGVEQDDGKRGGDDGCTA